MQWLLCGAVALAAGSPVTPVRDLDGNPLQPFAPARSANVLLLVSTDCPISNGYAPEIQRICREYDARGVSCVLVYEDSDADVAAVRRHLSDYQYRAIPATIDARHLLADELKATVTPEAVLVDRAGTIRYRGRIDNRYAALGKARPQATAHDLTDAVDAVLTNRAVAHPDTEAFGCFIPPPDPQRTPK